jgi:hypothetical protein
MQKLLAALLALFAFGLLYVLHEHAQTGRYQLDPKSEVILDTKTGAMYAIPQSRATQDATLLSKPIP